MLTKMLRMDITALHYLLKREDPLFQVIREQFHLGWGMLTICQYNWTKIKTKWGRRTLSKIKMKIKYSRIKLDFHKWLILIKRLVVRSSMGDPKEDPKMDFNKIIVLIRVRDDKFKHIWIKRRCSIIHKSEWVAKKSYKWMVPLVMIRTQQILQIYPKLREAL